MTCCFKWLELVLNGCLCRVCVSWRHTRAQELQKGLCDWPHPSQIFLYLLCICKISVLQLDVLCLKRIISLQPDPEILSHTPPLHSTRCLIQFRTCNWLLLLDNSGTEFAEVFWRTAHILQTANSIAEWTLLEAPWWLFNDAFSSS